MILLCLFILFTVARCLLHVIDSWFITTKQGRGEVVEKSYTLAYTQTVMIYNAALKMHLPSSIHHPDEWSLEVKMDNLTGDVSVEEEFYHLVSKGDLVRISYVLGRMTGGLYIKTIDFA